MKKRIKLAFIVAGILLSLAVLKPSEDNFSRFVNKKFEKIESNDSWKSKAKKSARNLSKSVLNAQSQLTVEYEDKIFFALIDFS